jgi:RNA polymerase sigma-70 factor (ECF subfamily)
MASSSLTTSLSASLGSLASERTGMEEAFDRHGPAIYRYLVVRVGGDTHVADDLMQQLWLRATNGQAPVHDGELEYWLRAIARNLVRAHWRQVRQRPVHLPIADPALANTLADRLGTEELPPDALDRREVRDQLLLALTSLSSQDQELIVGHYFQGRTHAELAGASGLSVRAVEGRLYRARSSLQWKLRELHP